LGFISELKKQSSLGQEPKADFFFGGEGGLWPLFPYPQAEKNNFGLGTILESCLVSELEKPSL
jgi:hypothetical protein